MQCRRQGKGEKKMREVPTSSMPLLYKDKKAEKYAENDLLMLSE